MGQAAIQAGVPVDVRQETPSSLSFQASITLLVLQAVQPLERPSQPLQGSSAVISFGFCDKSAAFTYPPLTKLMQMHTTEYNRSVTGRKSVHRMYAEGNSVVSVDWMHEEDCHVHLDPASHAAHDSQISHMCVYCESRGIACSSSFTYSGPKALMMRVQANNSVEAVVCLQSLKMLPDLPRFVAEAHRVLKPGSPFIFLQPGG